MNFWQNNLKSCQKFFEIDHELRALAGFEVIVEGREDDGLAVTRRLGSAGHSVLEA